MIVECEDKENQEDTTDSGIVITAKALDSGDKAMPFGKVISVGGKELTDDGRYIVPDVREGDTVWFNRYNAFKVVTRGLKTYWVVSCKDIWCVGDL